MPVTPPILAMLSAAVLIIAPNMVIAHGDGSAAVVATGYAANFTKVHLENIPIPTAPGPKEVVLRVSHSSVNPLDVELTTGALAKIFPINFPQTLGMDVAGVVELCKGCERLRVGDKVFGTTGPARYGAFAQWAVANEDSLTFAPKRISPLEAATLPVVGMTSVQALAWAGLRSGPWTPGQKNQTLFVTNGAGGTGTTGIQAAKAFGVDKVYAVTSTSNVPYVTALGADEVIDYSKTPDVWAQVPDGSLDVVYDNLGLAGTVDKAMPKMRQGGRIVIIKGQLSEHPRSDVKQTFLIMNSTHYTDLDTLRMMVERGQMKPHVQKAYGITEWAEAFRVQQEGHVVGKLAFDVAAA